MEDRQTSCHPPTMSDYLPTCREVFLLDRKNPLHPGDHPTADLPCQARAGGLPFR